MTLTEEINSDFTKALRNKDQGRLSVLRMLKSAIKNAEIAEKKLLNDSEITKIVLREVKQRKDSIESFSSAGRNELAEKERIELNFLEKYLPKQLSESEIDDLIQSSINETGAKSVSEMGKIMANLMPKIAGKADGSTVSKKVRDFLQG